MARHNDMTSELAGRCAGTLSFAWGVSASLVRLSGVYSAGERTDPLSTGGYGRGVLDGCQ